MTQNGTHDTWLDNKIYREGKIVRNPKNRGCN